VGQLDGVVETVETGTRRAFHNADELWDILSHEAATDARARSLDPDEQE